VSPQEPKDVWSERRTAFGAQAAAYATGRPGYPNEALRWIVPAEASRVLDLAAGTGRLTEQLLTMGNDVVAVEPDAAMRSHVPASAQVLDGKAEAIPLDDQSVDCVGVGTAFHWFDGPVAMAEIHRVLRPGGTVGLLWNMLDDSVPWVWQFADIMNAEARASVLDPTLPPPYRDVEGMGVPERRTFPHLEPYDVDRLLAYVHSWSQTILMSESERSQLLDEVRAVVPSPTFDLPFVCEVWRGERTD
jgi:SAM-dependent methyltransferase